MENKIIILIILGYIFGYIIGWLHNKYTFKIDGKKNVNDYMEKHYGKDWGNFKQQDNEN